MKEDIKYPYIARNKSNVEMLLFSESKAIILSEINKGIEHDVHPSFSKNYTNITHEYLANTYGKVVSKEHAEFIVEMCEVNGITGASYTGSELYFSIDDDGLIFWDSELLASKYGEEQIAIPLPPREVEVKVVNNTDNKVSITKSDDGKTVYVDVEPKYSECDSKSLSDKSNYMLKDIDFQVESVDLSKLVDVADDFDENQDSKEIEEMKNNGDNLILGCEELKRDWWPKVGDNFIHKGELVTCISKGVTSKGDEVVTFEGADKLSHGSCWNIDAWVKKPKTPEEELKEELIDVFKSSLDGGHFVGNLLSKFVVDKKPK